jgi:hypothetical protein
VADDCLFLANPAALKPNYNVSGRQKLLLLGASAARRLVL